MSCVVSFLENNTLYFVADSRVSDIANSAGPTIVPSVFLKVYTHPTIPKLLIGFTGSLKLIQEVIPVIESYDNIILQELSPHIHTTYDFVRSLVLHIERYLGEKNLLKRDPDNKAGIFIDCDLLIGYKGDIFLIPENLAIIPISQKFYAIGEGAPFALAQLAYIARKNMVFTNEIETVMSVTADYCASVAAPYVTYSYKVN